jgi:hypothetical protein
MTLDLALDPMFFLWVRRGIKGGTPVDVSLLLCAPFYANTLASSAAASAIHDAYPALHLHCLLALPRCLRCPRPGPGRCA